MKDKVVKRVIELFSETITLKDFIRLTKPLILTIMEVAKKNESLMPDRKRRKQVISNLKTRRSGDEKGLYPRRNK